MINDKNIISLGQNRVCPYLLSQGLLDAIVDSMSYDKTLKSIFKNSIKAYEKHDFSIQEMPAMSIFISDFALTSRSSLEEGNISIRIFFPTTTSRDRAMVSMATITRYIANYLQSPTAFSLIIDNLIKLPEKNADNYDAVVAYKATGNSPLMEIFSEFEITLPREQTSNFLAEIKSSYTIDMQNWMYFLETIGIDYTDPNTIIYPIIEEWNLEVEAESVL